MNKKILILTILIFIIVLIILFSIYHVSIYEELIYYYSKDATTPYINLSNKKSIKHLKRKWETIRNEMLRSRENFIKIKGDLYFNESIIKDNKWKKIYLKWYSEAPDYSYELFPETMKIIDKYPEIKLAMFSLLEPGAKILPHRGPFKGAIRVHLTLVSPNSNDCWIKVDGKKYSWRDREIICFDDTYTHEVQNNTDKERIILFLDIERKMNSSIISGLNKFIINYIAPTTSRKNSNIL